VGCCALCRGHSTRCGGWGLASRALSHRTLAVFARAGIRRLIRATRCAARLDRYGSVVVTRWRCWDAGGADLPHREVFESTDGLSPRLIWSRRLLPRLPGPKLDAGTLANAYLARQVRRARPYAPALAMVRHGYDSGRSGIFQTRPRTGPKEHLAVMRANPQGRRIREPEGGSATLVELNCSVRRHAGAAELAAFSRVWQWISRGVAIRRARQRVARGAGGEVGGHVMIAARAGSQRAVRRNWAIPHAGAQRGSGGAPCLAFFVDRLQTAPRVPASVRSGDDLAPLCGSDAHTGFSATRSRQNW